MFMGQIMAQFDPQLTMLRVSVLERHNLTEADFEYIMSTLVESDDELAKYNNQISGMFEAIFTGGSVSIDGVEIDPRFDEETLFKIIDKSSTYKREHLQKSMKDLSSEFASGNPSPHIVEEQMKKAEEFEIKALEENGFQASDRLAYRVAVTHLSNTSTTFSEKRKSIQEADAKIAQELLKPKPTMKMAKEIAEAKGVVPEINSDDVSAIIESSQPDQSPIVLLIVDEDESTVRLLNSADALAKMSHAAEQLSIDATGHVSINYGYISLENALKTEYAPLANAANKLKEAAQAEDAKASEGEDDGERSALPVYFMTTFFEEGHAAKTEVLATWAAVRIEALTGMETGLDMD